MRVVNLVVAASVFITIFISVAVTSALITSAVHTQFRSGPIKVAHDN